MILGKATDNVTADAFNLLTYPSTQSSPIIL
jgi:hypothetical protein